MKPIVLPTKIHIPPRLTQGIHRQRLVDLLNLGLEMGRSLTLISAPAGFGKSTCASEWISKLDFPVAWFSLDKADDDPARFFTYFVAVLQKIDKSLGFNLQNILDSGQILPAQSFGSIILKDIHNFNRHFILVLDDFHIIQENFILEFLEMIITNLPSLIHFVIISREDPLIPLARFRANNLMTEIRAEDLRFTDSESKDFFSKTMGLALPEEDLRILNKRIEGWAAGLQLAGLSILGQENPSTFISNLSGTQRHILSYLTEEVLDHQSLEMQNFLIKISIFDKMCAELCDTVTERNDSRILLNQIYSNNLFLVPLDDDQRWFRYHHLFADLLRNQLSRLSKEELSHLHRNASRWFNKERMVTEAIEHALAGEDYSNAVKLLEQHTMNFVMQGHVKTVENWMQAIPPSLQSHSPRANLAFANVYLMRGNYVEVANHLYQAEAAIFQKPPISEMADSATASLQAEWYAIQSNLFNVRGEFSEGLSAAKKSLQFARPEEFHIQAIAYMGLGGAYRLIGDYSRIVETFQKAIQNSHAAENQLAEMLSSAALALVAIQHGQLKFAQQIGVDAISRYEINNLPPPPIAGSVYAVLGLIELERNQLETARKYFTKTLQLNSLGGHNAGIVFVKILMAQLSQSEGNLIEAAALTNEAVKLLPLGVPAWLNVEVISHQVRMYLVQNNPVAAEAILRQIPGSFQEPQKFPNELIFIAHLRVMYYHLQKGDYTGDLQEPLNLADHMIEKSIERQRLGIALEIILVLVQIHSLLENIEDAKEGLIKALLLAEPEGYFRPFLNAGSDIYKLLKILQKQNIFPETTKKLLAAFSSVSISIPSLPEQSGLFDPLSARELEVLRLLSKGLTNPEIASHLIISLSTVKTHLIHIYGKLNVRNRAEAVMKGKDIGIL